MSIPNTIIVPPPPYRVPFVDPSGIISQAWSKWIGQLYLRAGGASSPSTAGIVSAITTLQANVGVLQTSISTINTEVDILNGLLLGRQL